MAISRQRLTAPLVRGNVPEEHAAEFSNGLVEEVERELEPLATKVEVNEAIAQATEPLARAINGLTQAINDLGVEAAEREARMTRMVLTVTGINIAAIATGVGIVLGFN